MLDVVQTGGLLDIGAFDFLRLFKCGSLPTFRVETLGTCRPQGYGNWSKTI